MSFVILEGKYFTFMYIILSVFPAFCILNKLILVFSRLSQTRESVGLNHREVIATM